MPRKRWWRAVDAAGALLLVAALALVFWGHHTSSKEKAQSAQCGIYMQKVFAAVDQHYLDTGSVPLSLEQLMVNAEAHAYWDGPYLQRSDLVDPWGRAWVYRNHTQGPWPYRLEMVDQSHACRPEYP